MANTTILIKLQKKLLSKHEEDMAKNYLQEKLANKKDDKIV